jgi:hypothetical protein
MRLVHDELKRIAGRPAAAGAPAVTVAGRTAVQDETVVYRPAPAAKPAAPLSPPDIAPNAPAAARKSKLAVLAIGLVAVLGVTAAILKFNGSKPPETVPPPPPAVVEQPKEPQPNEPAAATPAPPPPQAVQPAAPPTPKPAATVKTAEPKETKAVEPPPAAPATPSEAQITLKDALPVQLSLSSAVSEDADKGDKLSFTAMQNVVVDGATVIAKGATAKGTIVEGSRRKILGRKSDITMLFDTIEAVDGKQVRLREAGLRRSGAERKPRALGKLVGKDGVSAVPAGTQYVAYIDGDVTVSVPKH